MYYSDFVIVLFDSSGKAIKTLCCVGQKKIGVIFFQDVFFIHLVQINITLPFNILETEIFSQFLSSVEIVLLNYAHH